MTGWVRCLGCDGSGKVQMPRAKLCLETGEVTTVIALARCLHCRENPGWQRLQTEGEIMATEDEPWPQSTCPSCGQTVGGAVGTSAPNHRDQDGKACPGGTTQ